MGLIVVTPDDVKKAVEKYKTRKLSDDRPEDDNWHAGLRTE